jgi:hypothetical protein
METEEPKQAKYAVRIAVTTQNCVSVTQLVWNGDGYANCKDRHTRLVERDVPGYAAKLAEWVERGLRGEFPERTGRSLPHAP